MTRQINMFFDSKQNAKLAISVFTFVAVLLPVVSMAAGLVPCDTNCDYNKLIELGQNIINYAIVISIPIAAIAFAWAGFLFMTAAGNESQVSHAKSIATKVLVGFIVALSAWLVVYTITSNLLVEDTPLGPSAATP